jgi:hypothetical protein
MFEVSIRVHFGQRLVRQRAEAYLPKYSAWHGNGEEGERFMSPGPKIHCTYSLATEFICIRSVADLVYGADHASWKLKLGKNAKFIMFVSRLQFLLLFTLLVIRLSGRRVFLVVCGEVKNRLPTPEFEPRTVRPVENRYND